MDKSSALYVPGPNDSYLTHAKYTVFGVVFLLTGTSESRWAKFPSYSSQLWSLALLLFHYTQVLQLALSPMFRWYPQVTEYASKVSVVYNITSMHNTIASVVALVVGVVLLAATGLALHNLGQAFRGSTNPSDWLLLLARHLVILISTALSVPLATLFSMPLTCASMQDLFGSTYTCWDGIHVAIAIACSLCLLALGVLCLGSWFLNFAADADSPHIMARVSGRSTGFTGIADLLLAIAVTTSFGSTVLTSLAIVILGLCCIIHRIITLPYFRRWLNRLASASQTAVTWLMLGAGIRDAIGDDVDHVRTFSIIWCSLTVLMLLIGAWLPSIKYRALRRRIQVLRVPMNHYLSASPGNSLSAAAGAAGVAVMSFRSLVSPKTGSSEDERAAASFVGSETGDQVAPLPGDSGDAAGPGAGSSGTPILKRSNSVQRGIKRLRRVASRVRNRFAKVTAVTRFISDLSYKPAQTPFENQQTASVHQLAADGMALPNHDTELVASVLNRCAVHDIELMARVMLEDREHMEAPPRRWWLRPTPNTDGIEHAMWLFAVGASEFSHSPAEIADIKIAFAAFMHVYVGDSNLATVALEAAHHEHPVLDGAFQVFSRIRSLQDMRERQESGGGGKRAAVTTAQIQSQFAEALRHHRKALRAVLHIFVSVSEHLARASNRGAEQALGERLGRLLNDVSDETALSQTVYKRILSASRLPPNVTKAYQEFSTYVLNNAELASQYNKTSDNGSVSDAGSSVTSTARIKEFRPKPRTATVSRMHVQFRCGLVLLAVVAVAMCTVTQIFFSGDSRSMDSLHLSGNHTKHAVSAPLQARYLHVHARQAYANGLGDHDPDLIAVRRRTLAQMEHLYTAFRSVYSAATETGGDILQGWHTNNLDVDRLLLAGAEPVRMATHHNMADLTTEVVVQDAELARLDTIRLRRGPDLTIWRLVMDNSIQTMLPNAAKLATALQHRVIDTADTYLYVQLPLFVLTALIVLVLGYCVFLRGLRRMKVIDRGILEVALLIPPMTVTKLVREYRAAVKRIQRIQAALIRQMRDMDDFASESDGSDVSAGAASRASDEASLGHEVGGGVVLDDDDAGYPSWTPRGEGDADADAAVGAGAGAGAGAGVGFSLAAGGDAASIDSGIAVQDSGREPGADEAAAVPARKAGTPRRKAGTPRRKAGTPRPEPADSDEDADGTGSDVSSGAGGDAYSDRMDSARMGSVGFDGIGMVNPMADEADSKVDPSAMVVMPAGHPPTAAGGGGSGGSGGSCPFMSAKPNQQRMHLPPLEASAASKAKLPQMAAPPGGKRLRFASRHQMRAGDGDTEVARAPSFEPVTMLDVPDLAAVFDCQPAATIMINTRGIVVSMNETAEQLSGYGQTELIGNTVELLMREELRARHQSYLDRVTSGLPPRVIGKLGREVKLLHKEGYEIPVLLGLAKVTGKDGELYYLASIADLRNHSATQDAAADAEQEEVQKEDAQIGLKLRVLVSLLFVACIQVLTAGVGTWNMQITGEFATEVAAANRCEYLARLVAFRTQELIIGDHEFDTAANLLADLAANRDELSLYRFALRFGNSSLGLLGSADRYDAQDALQFDATATAFETSAANGGGGGSASAGPSATSVQGSGDHGLDRLVSLFLDQSDQLSRKFQANPAGVTTGANATALAAVPELAFMRRADEGTLAELLAKSSALYLQESQEYISRYANGHLAVTALSLVVTAALYIVVFRKMIGRLYDRARRTESLLELMPEEVITSGALSKYYVRNSM